MGVCSDGPGVHVSANCSDRERSTNISHIANCEGAYESSSFLKKELKEMKIKKRAKVGRGDKGAKEPSEN